MVLYLRQERERENAHLHRDLFKADLVSRALEYQKDGTISDFDSADITIDQGTGKRDVAAAAALKFNDSMEKLYLVTNVI